MALPAPGPGPLQSGLLAAPACEEEPSPGGKSSAGAGEASCSCLPAPGPGTSARRRLCAWLPDVHAVEFAAEFCWILSEAAWILLIPPVCLPIGLLAFILMGAVAVHRCASAGCRGMQQWLPLFMQAEWLLTNFCWMLEEMLFDSPGEQTPWRMTPMAGDRGDLYDELQLYCILSFLVAPLAWALALAGQAWAGLGRSRGGEGGGLRAACRPALGLFCQGGYIASWALMDAVWAAELLWSSVLCCGATLALIAANAAWESGEGLRGADRTDAVWALWTLANLLWIVGELGTGDRLAVRYAAAALAFASLGLLLCSRRQAVARADLRAGAAAAAPAAAAALGA